MSAETVPAISRPAKEYAMEPGRVRVWLFNTLRGWKKTTSEAVDES
jgi:hypothetical protein